MGGLCTELLNAILEPMTQGDSLLARRAEEGIVAALGESAGVGARVAAAVRVRETLAQPGFAHVDVSGQAGLGPLFLEDELARACRRVAAHGTATVVVTGLGGGLRGVRRTRSRAESLGQVERALRERLSPRARVRLVAVGD
jgi:hypothetical protein